MAPGLVRRWHSRGDSARWLSGNRGPEPGADDREQLANFDHPLGVFNVVGNIAMFVPLGWLVALVAERRRLLIGAIAGFGVSATIEVTQWLIGY